MRIPSATEDEKQNGWTLSTEWLQAIQKISSTLYEDTPDLETIETILLVATALQIQEEVRKEVPISARRAGETLQIVIDKLKEEA